jgi:hypothetical protein
MPSIREIATASPVKTAELPRLEWVALLQKIPPQADPVLESMRADLLYGSSRLAVDTVHCWKEQVLKMCDLADGAI